MNGARWPGGARWITAFSARVLPDGLVPTLETLPASEALAKVKVFAEKRAGEQGLILAGVAVERHQRLVDVGADQHIGRERIVVDLGI